MTTTTRTPTGTLTGMIEIAEPGFLAALRLADSALPTGLFTQSHGLEAFVHAGRVRDGRDVQQVLEDYLEEQIAPADAVAAACAWRAAAAENVAGIIDADQSLGALKLCRETREGSARSGGRLLLLAVELTHEQRLVDLLRQVQGGQTPGHYATVFGAVGWVFQIPLDALLQMELHSFAVSFLGAAMRLLRYDHMEAQRTLSALQPLMIRLAHAVRDRELAEMRSFCPLAEVMSMHHERGRVRLFSS